MNEVLYESAASGAVEGVKIAISQGKGTVLTKRDMW